MADRRKKNIEWFVANEDGVCESVQHAQLAVLMDIRDELERLNTVFHCSNFLDVPRKLDRIARNTAKKRRTTRKART